MQERLRTAPSSTPEKILHKRMLKRNWKSEKNNCWKKSD